MTTSHSEPCARCIFNGSGQNAPNRFQSCDTESGKDMRNRTLHKRFWSDGILQSCAIHSRLVFAWLINAVDGKGRLQAGPNVIAQEVFPNDKNNVQLATQAIEELESKERIMTYDIHDIEYILLVRKVSYDKGKFQSVSKLPAPPSDKLKAIKGMTKKMIDELIDNSPWGESVSKGDASSVTSQARDIFQEWKLAHRKVNSCRLTTKRTDKVIARLREGYTKAQIIAACRGILLSRWHDGHNDRQTVYRDLWTICRDGGQVEKFADMYRGWCAIHGDGAMPPLHPDEEIKEKEFLTPSKTIKRQLDKLERMAEPKYDLDSVEAMGDSIDKW